MQTVVLNDMESSTALVTSGLLQCSVLGPFLFKIYINDLLLSTFQNEIVAFLDDSKIFACVTNEKSLQADIDKFVDGQTRIK